MTTKDEDRLAEMMAAAMGRAIAGVLPTLVAAIKGPELTPDERAQKELSAIRKGGLPIWQADYQGTGRVVGKSGEPMPPPSMPPVRVLARYNTSGPRAGVAVEVNEDAAGKASVNAALNNRFDLEHPQLVHEAEGDPERRSFYEKQRSTWVGRAFYWEFKLPLTRAVVGKTRDESGHVIKWDPEPVWTSGPAPTDAAATSPAPAPAPEPNDVPPAPPSLTPQEKREGMLSDAKPSRTPYPGI
jgi:hypothetical protein